MGAVLTQNTLEPGTARDRNNERDFGKRVRQIQKSDLELTFIHRTEEIEVSSEGKFLIFFDAAKKWKATEIVMYSSPPRLVTMSQALVRTAHGAFRE